MARWKSLEEYSPVARLLVEYMWEQRPPLLPSQFAAQMGVPKQLVSSWLTSQVLPTPGVLLHLARRMNQPVSRLLVAAGYATSEDPLMDIPGAWSYVLLCIEQYQDQSDTEGMDALLSRLRPIQEQAISQWQPGVAPEPGEVESESGGVKSGPSRLTWRRPRRRQVSDESDARSTDDEEEDEESAGSLVAGTQPG
jgi:transcriptional regulator with XRE-family HTH domain